MNSQEFIFYLFNYKTYFLIKIIPVARIASTVVVKARYVGAVPVEISNITGASSISSSPGTLLFGVESISGELLSFLSALISATFVFSPKLLSPLIHFNVTCTEAVSPGCNSVFANAFVVIILSEDCVHCELSAGTNSNPSGI